MSKKILVVEDSRAFQSYLQQQLTQAGYDVLMASSIAEANQIMAEHNHFLCAILDYCLPDGENGEVIDIVLSHGHKIILLTGMFQEDIREKMLTKGVIDYILKDSKASVSYLLPLIKRITNNKKHTALIVDDSSFVRKHISQLLEGQYINVLQAQDGVKALEVIENHPDITFIITDHDMPRKDGISMIQDIRKVYDKNQLAILGVSGSDDRTMTARFLKAGANDFLYKPFNQEEFFCRVHQILDMKDVATELYNMANQDALTGLWNRRYFFNQTVTENTVRNIAMLDIDYFKRVNDTYGHDGGDMVLITLSNILKLYFKNQLVARFGGEEFCIQSSEPLDVFIQQLEKMRQRIEKTTIIYNDQSLSITISIGVCGEISSLEQQLKQADARLYLAKENGRNQIIVEG